MHVVGGVGRGAGLEASSAGRGGNPKALRVLGQVGAGGGRRGPDGYRVDWDSQTNVGGPS